MRLPEKSVRRNERKKKKESSPARLLEEMMIFLDLKVMFTKD